MSISNALTALTNSNQVRREAASITVDDASRAHLPRGVPALTVGERLALCVRIASLPELGALFSCDAFRAHLPIAGQADKLPQHAKAVRRKPTTAVV